MIGYMRHLQQRIRSRLDYRTINRSSEPLWVIVHPNTLLLLLVLGFTSGCSGISSIGLQPEYPPFKKGSFELWGEFVEVNSLQPTLRWQRFPRAKDQEADTEGNLDRVENVSYELRVWKTVYGNSGRLVYARAGLKTTSHAVEQPLEPLTKYIWTVRAQFLLDGRYQVNEWGLAGYLLRDDVVPNRSCFRFITPASAQDQ